MGSNKKGEGEFVCITTRGDGGKRKKNENGEVLKCHQNRKEGWPEGDSEGGLVNAGESERHRLNGTLGGGEQIYQKKR